MIGYYLHFYMAWIIQETFHIQGTRSKILQGFAGCIPGLLFKGFR